MDERTIGEVLKSHDYTLLHNVFGDDNKIILLKCVTMLGDAVYVKVDTDSPCKVRTHVDDVHFEKTETDIIHHEVKKAYASMMQGGAHDVLFECPGGICQVKKCNDLTTQSTSWVKKTVSSASSKTHEYVVEKENRCPRKYPIVLYSDIKNSSYKVALKVRKLYNCYNAVRCEKLYCGMSRFDSALEKAMYAWECTRKKIDCQLTMAVDSLYWVDADLMTMYCMLHAAEARCEEDACKLRDKICKLKLLRTLLDQFIDKCFCWINSVTSNADCLESLCNNLDVKYPALCEFFHNVFNKACECTGEDSKITFDPKTTIINEKRVSAMINGKWTAHQMLAEGVTIDQLSKRGYSEKQWRMSDRNLSSRLRSGESPAVLLASGASLEQLMSHKVTPYSKQQVLETFGSEDGELADSFRNAYDGEDVSSALRSPEASLVSVENVLSDSASMAGSGSVGL